MTLGNVQLGSRENNLNAIRLVAATSVTFGHSFVMLSGSGKSHPTLFGLDTGWFGFLAVAVFFALSGILITRSFLAKAEWLPFLEARILRIFPGLIFANVVTAIIVSQVLLGQGFSALVSLENWKYVYDATVFRLTDYSGVFKAMPVASANGSLWTLPIEFRHYLFVLALGVVGCLKRRTWFVGLMVFLFLVAAFRMDVIFDQLFPLFFDISSYDSAYLSLPLSFCIGMFACLYAEKFILNIPVAIAALVFSIAFGGWLGIVVAFAYAAIVFGFHTKVYVPRLNFRNDISYGVYVLSWPVQQMLIYTKLATSPWAVFVGTMLIVVPLAYISWRFIEKPSLRLKGKLKAFFQQKFSRIN